MRFPVTPALIDGILVFVAVEFVAVGGLLIRGSASELIAPWSFYLASGAFLLLALRASLSAAEPRWIALALGMSLSTHAALLWWLVQARSRASWVG